VREPALFLMDEPLSNLDAKMRESLRIELQHLQKTQRSTTLFVTHDQIEALTMADRIAVLNEGQIVQVGTPEDIYDRPATTFVSQLVGSPHINLMKARGDNGSMIIQDSDLRMPYPSCEKAPGSFLLGIRPEDIRPETQGSYAGELVLTEPLGVETILHLKIGKQTVTSLVPGMTDFRIGDVVRFNVVEERLHCFSIDGKRIISE
jgi:ABC-type sugar transport system ATPase subunit